MRFLYGIVNSFYRNIAEKTPRRRIPPGMPPWFFERDKDQDGQLTMQEYATGQTWTEALVGEFEFLDRNNDGVATSKEIFASLQEFDEKKRLQEEQAQREIARRKGGASTPPSPPPPSAAVLYMRR